MEVNKKLQGLGGWLVFFHIFLYLSTIAYFVTASFFAFAASFTIFTSMNWFAIGVVIGAVALMVFHIDLLKKFYGRKVSFPRRAIIVVWLPLAFVVLIPLSWPLQKLVTWVLYAIWAVAWTLYFRKSIRVRNTFVN